MAKTFKNIVDKYQISRPALYKRIRKIPNFQEKYMSKVGNMWLIKDEGVKLITHKKRNSTSPFKPKSVTKIKRKGHYKERQPTKNDLLDWFKKISTANLKLSETNRDQQQLINKLKNNLDYNHKQLENYQEQNKKLLTYKRHGFWWKLFH